MHKAPLYLLTEQDKAVEAHLEDHEECPWCCTHLDYYTLAGARGRAETMGYLTCDRDEKETS